MGSPANETGRDADEGPQKYFSISPFWMGAYEVTYDEFNTFFTDESVGQNEKMDAITRPSPPYIDFTLGMGKEGGYPANSMQQYGAVMYCRWLYKKTGYPPKQSGNMPVARALRQPIFLGTTQTN